MALYTSSHLNMHSVIAAPDKQLVAPGWMGAVAPDLPGEIHAIYPLRPTKSSPMILSPMSTRTSVMLIWQVLTTNLVVLFFLSTLGFLPPAGNTMLEELTIQTMQSPCTPGPMLQFNILQISCTDSYVVCSISDRFRSKHNTTSFSPGNWSRKDKSCPKNKATTTTPFIPPNKIFCGTFHLTQHNTNQESWGFVLGCLFW